MSQARQPGYHQVDHNGQAATVTRLARWASQLPADHVVRLSCHGSAGAVGAASAVDAAGSAPVPGPDAAVQWPGCLSDLSAGSVAVLVAAAPSLQLMVDPCCRDSHAAEHRRPPRVAAQVDLVRQILQSWGITQRLLLLDLADPGGHTESASPWRPGSAPAGAGTGGEYEVDHLPMSRRSLLGLLGRGTAHELASSTPPPSTPPPSTRPSSTAPSCKAPEEDGLGEHAVGTTSQRHAIDVDIGRAHGQAADQVLLIAALREILRQHPRSTGAPSDRDPHTAAARPGRALSQAQVLESAGCTACSTCVRACPTGALALHTHPTDPSTVHLVMQTEACISCDQCIALCPAQALQAADRLDLAELAQRPPQSTLETVTVRTCARCRTPHGGRAELCQVCALRQSQPFGSWLPPGYVAPRVYAAPRTDGPAAEEGPPA